MSKRTKIIIGATAGIILTPIILVALGIGYVLWEDAKKQAQEDRVSMSIEYNTDVCSEEHPLAIGIFNQSDKTVSKVNFGLNIKRKGHSTNINGGAGYSSDNILAPDERVGDCWNYTLKSEYEKYNDPDNLEFEITYKNVYFQK